MKRYLFTYLLGFCTIFILIRDLPSLNIKNFHNEDRKYSLPLNQMIPTSNYGIRDNLPHWGQDYSATIGTPIYSPCYCSAISGHNERLGNFIILTDSNGVNFLFAHLSKNHIYDLSAVAVGEPIGETGNTGYSFGPHLHLEIYWGNFYFNPQEFF